MSKFSLPINPGHSLGEFQLGMPIAEVLKKIEDIKDIKRAEIEFDPLVGFFCTILIQHSLIIFILEFNKIFVGEV